LIFEPSRGIGKSLRSEQEGGRFGGNSVAEWVLDPAFIRKDALARLSDAAKGVPIPARGAARNMGDGVNRPSLS
jgi:hypothetical protein